MSYLLCSRLILIKVQGWSKRSGRSGYNLTNNLRLLIFLCLLYMTQLLFFALNISSKQLTLLGQQGHCIKQYVNYAIHCCAHTCSVKDVMQCIVVTCQSSTWINMSQLPEVSNSPHQPTFGCKFRKRSFGKTTTTQRSFQFQWFKQWPFLHYDEHNDVYCHTCVTSLKQKKMRSSNDYFSNYFRFIKGFPIGKMSLLLSKSMPLVPVIGSLQSQLFAYRLL